MDDEDPTPGHYTYFHTYTPQPDASEPPAVTATWKHPASGWSPACIGRTQGDGNCLLYNVAAWLNEKGVQPLYHEEIIDVGEANADRGGQVAAVAGGFHAGPRFAFAVGPGGDRVASRYAFVGVGLGGGQVAAVAGGFHAGPRFAFAVGLGGDRVASGSRFAYVGHPPVPSRAVVSKWHALHEAGCRFGR